MGRRFDARTSLFHIPRHPHRSFDFSISGSAPKCKSREGSSKSIFGGKSQKILLNMSDPFLNLPGTKRKRPSRPSKPSSRDDRRVSKSTSNKKRRLRDVPLESESDDEIGAGAIESDIEVGDEEEGDEENEHEDETPAERRLRLAKDYLEQVRLEAGMLHLSKG